MNESVKKLRRVFLVFIAIYIINLVFPTVGLYSYTQRMWLLATASVGLLSVMILIKEKAPGKPTILIGLLLGILAGLIRPLAGIVTFLAFISSMRIMEKAHSRIVILKRPVLLSILPAIGVGAVLGFINLVLTGGQTLEFVPSFYAFVLSLNPGISEEVIFRLFMYAFAIYLLGGRINTRKQTIWVYVLMIVPHILLHFPDTFFMDGVLRLDLGTLLVGPVILTLLFGLPMTQFLVKRDLTSAIITHTIVDFIRFVFLGLPL